MVLSFAKQRSIVCVVGVAHNRNVQTILRGTRRFLSQQVQHGHTSTYAPTVNITSPIVCSHFVLIVMLNDVIDRYSWA